MKTVLFHILNSFRGLILIALGLGALVAGLLMIITLFQDGVTGRVFGSALWFVIFGAARWHYDVLLFKLMPVPSSRQVG